MLVFEVDLGYWSRESLRACPEFFAKYVLVIFREGRYEVLNVIIKHLVQFINGPLNTNLEVRFVLGNFNHPLQ